MVLNIVKRMCECQYSVNGEKERKRTKSNHFKFRSFCMTSCISSLFHSPLQPCLRSLRDEGRISFTGGACVSTSSSMGTKASMNGVEGRMSEGRMLRRGEAGAVDGREREEGTYVFVTGCLRDGRAATLGTGARVKVRSLGASSSTGEGL